MSKINTGLFVILGTLTTAPFTAMAGESFTWDNVTTDLSVGTLSGKTKERVYDPDTGHKDSQLNWRFKNAAVINGAVDWELLPSFSLGLAGWTTLGKRSGLMEDYDWENENQSSWTSKSYHPSTQLNHANQFDINLKSWLFNEPNGRLGIMTGYQQTRYSFDARGGSYNYNNGTITGNFPDGTKVIGYRQTYKTPYIGVIGLYRYQQWELGGSFKYSAWARTSDVDEHYLVDTTFKSHITRQKFYSLAVNGGYYLTNNAKLYVEGTWSRTTNKKGWGEYNDREEGIRDGAKNSAGIENYSLMASVGLRYTF